METGIRNLKAALRCKVKETIDCMTLEERLLQSDYIADKVLKHPKYVTAKRVGIYSALPDEVQTAGILKDIFKVGKSCFVPRYNASSMNMIKIESMKELDGFLKTKQGISQPGKDYSGEDAFSAGGLDLLIVPGRAFTKEGHRLGRGRGLYDTYLGLYKDVMHSHPHTIGLAFAQQIFESVPVTDTDKKLDEVLYDDRDSEIFLTMEPRKEHEE